MFSSDRDKLRLQYVEAWRKHRAGEILSPLEDMIARVVADHPEYQGLLENEDRTVGREYLPEDGDTNPFLHMGMHLAIREQVATDRPKGIRSVHQTLSRRLGGPVEAEHLMLEPLGEALWTAQRSGSQPDERAYLLALQELVRQTPGF